MPAKDLLAAYWNVSLGLMASRTLCTLGSALVHDWPKSLPAELRAAIPSAAVVYEQWITTQRTVLEQAIREKGRVALPAPADALQAFGMAAIVFDLFSALAQKQASEHETTLAEVDLRRFLARQYLVGIVATLEVFADDALVAVVGPELAAEMPRGSLPDRFRYLYGVAGVDPEPFASLLSSLQVMVQVRHICVHAGGITTTRFLRKLGITDPAAENIPVALSDGELAGYCDLADEMAEETASRLMQDHFRDLWPPARRH